jgi:hypothetical protein
MKRIVVILLAALPVLAQIRGGGGGGGRMGNGGGGFSGPRGGGFNGPGRGAPPPPSRPTGGGLVGNPYGNLGPTPFSNGTYGAGFGSVVFPSGIRSYGSVGSPIYSSQPVLGGRPGGFIGGGFIGSPARTAIYPVPVFVGGGYYGTGNGYQDQPVTVINQQPPTIIINQAYEPDSPARPVMRVYGNGADSSVNTIQVPAPSYPEGRPLAAATDLGNDSVNPTDEPTVYLIALKDGTIYASYAFWAEHDTLHYITPGHAHNQVSLDQVDMTLSRRLNRERKLEFNLR